MIIKKIKIWLKIKKLNDLWMHICSVSDKVNHEEKLSYAKQMREVIQQSSEAELDKVTIQLSEHIKKIKTTRKTAKLESNENCSLL